MTGLTEQEQAVIEQTVALWNTIMQCPTLDEHPDQLMEIRAYVHAIQNTVAALPTFRVMNGKV